MLFRSMTMRETVPAKAAAYKEALLKLKEISLGKSLEEIKAECEKYKQGQETAKARDQILLSWDKDFLGEDARSLIKEYKEAETKWALFKTISVNSVYKKVAVYDLKKERRILCLLSLLLCRNIRRGRRLILLLKTDLCSMLIQKYLL